ncbi:hypothetical protein [Flavobacterium wongokense]|uniref:hypothetical protein n=1 Tax=Flavobacterium wongokense TaxID=2910674 RepID=UPI001F3E3D45|nr:hypothetical protein [Flavobacterium sp. WG47]MCF6131397.1 hypothetical protein [Flavobacterium sp. WG47]
MKTITTITPKNALKLFLFLLILFSAKAFSFSRLPNKASSTGCESRIGCADKMKKAPSKTYAMASKSTAMQSKKRFKK